MTLFGALLLIWFLPTLIFVAAAVIAHPMALLARRLLHEGHDRPRRATEGRGRSADMGA